MSNIDKRIHTANRTEIGINWIWDWYETEEQALEIVRDNEYSLRDSTKDNKEHGFCVASR